MKKYDFIAHRLLCPEVGLNTEPDLFYHSNLNAGFDTEKKVYYCGRSSVISFNSYFNAFPLHNYCLDERHSLKVRIRYSGTANATVHFSGINTSYDILANSRIASTKIADKILNIPLDNLQGLIYLSFYAETYLMIQDIDFIICGPQIDEIKIAGVITTFKRDQAVQDTCNRLSNYFADNRDIERKFGLFIIDNGGDTNSINFKNGKIIKNSNYGGAGGFSRGLYEVKKEGSASHVLFMDDDASFFPETIRRTLSLLLYSDNPKTAIAGAMITEEERYKMWENGAVFDNKCHPLDSGVDLRNFRNVLNISSNGSTKYSNMYGGWWYFCFRIDRVEVWPFPFFVRGDDVSFALANDFNIKRIIGIASHQSDFFMRENPMTVYLDMRSHFVHYLTVSRENRSLAQDLKMFSKFYLSFSFEYKYERANSVIEALNDVMKGKDFWKENLDMVEKRSVVNGYFQIEKPIDNIAINISKSTFDAKAPSHSLLIRVFRIMTLNGHLLPSFLDFSKGRVLGLHERGGNSFVFRRPHIIYLDRRAQTGIFLKKNKKTFFKNTVRFLLSIIKYSIKRKKMISLYAEAYGDFTREKFWKENLTQHLDLREKTNNDSR